ncbi:hypothetical protein Tco_0597398 [Tanacetum coccineum]
MVAASFLGFGLKLLRFDQEAFETKTPCCKPGSAALSSLYETPRCDEFHELQEIHVIVKAGYGIEFAYVILSYNIVLKLGDPSPVLKQGQGETKSNPTTS